MVSQNYDLSFKTTNANKRITNKKWRIKGCTTFFAFFLLTHYHNIKFLIIFATYKQKHMIMDKFKLMVLPYKEDALEPVVSKETIGFHHGKHLAAYVNNLNGLLAGSGFEEATLEEVVCKSTGSILNNAGQILNHNLYFSQFKSPSANNAPKGILLDAINEQFGSFDAFQKEFVQKGATLFGSGWVWLSADKDGKLVITQETNAANPIQRGLKPLLTFDVWEHAYYLDYQNRRPDHLTALWQIVNWEEIERRLKD